MIAFISPDTSALLAKALKDAGVEYEAEFVYTHLLYDYMDGADVVSVDETKALHQDDPHLAAWRAGHKDEAVNVLGPAFSTCEAEEALLKSGIIKHLRIDSTDEWWAYTYKQETHELRFAEEKSTRVAALEELIRKVKRSSRPMKSEEYNDDVK